MRPREDEEEGEQPEQARQRLAADDAEMAFASDDEEDLAAFRAAGEARGALNANQREEAAIENFVQGSQVTLLIASTQNQGTFGTDKGRREDVFNLIAEAQHPFPQRIPCTIPAPSRKGEALLHFHLVQRAHRLRAGRTRSLRTSSPRRAASSRTLS